MATVKQVLDKHFFSFLDENGLESLKEKMIKTITKAEYELDDVIDDMYDDKSNACIDLENEVDLLNEEIQELEEELKSKDTFFEPETLEDEFKIQWIKDNWNKIPSI
jgi:predicted  nucleic acid-binding Zn-ribbon protein